MTPDLIRLLAVLAAAGGCCSGSRTPVLLLSLDGFRWDYPYTYRDRLPNLWKLIGEGAFIEGGLNNAFVTKTFPNHRTLVTGQWEETHGIIANQFWHVGYNQTFTPDNKDIRFWNASKPIWQVLEERNVTSAAIQFPGSYVREQQPTYTSGFPQYDPNATFPDLLHIARLAMTHPHDPALFTALYYLEPDHTGHLYGPDSAEMGDKLAELDGYIKSLAEMLADVNGVRVNLLLTSDHGMARVDKRHVILFPDFVSASSCAHVSIAETEVLVWPAEGREEQLWAELANLTEAFPSVRAYNKSDIPAVWHYSASQVIPPVLVVADEGWVLSGDNGTRPDRPGFVFGQHGYDARLPDMHPLFLGWGPDFRPGFKLTGGQVFSVDVFPLVMYLLNVDVDPASFNGSLSDTLALLRHRDAHRPPSFSMDMGVVVGCSMLVSLLVLIVALYVLGAGRQLALCPHTLRSLHARMHRPPGADELVNDVEDANSAHNGAFSF